MSMEVKLNVVANKLAGDYQDQLGSYRPITHVSIYASCIINQWDDNNKQHQTSTHKSIHRAEIHMMPPGQI